MSSLSRRRFLTLLAGAAASLPLAPSQAAGRRVVVIGGGAGGTIAARSIRALDPGISVTLMEPNAQYLSCLMSNEVLAGDRSAESLKFGYGALSKQGIEIVHDAAARIDAAAKKVSTRGGRAFTYDRLIVSPGVALDFHAIPGYDEAASRQMPHAWADGRQIETLRKQLTDMRAGGTVVIALPRPPFRCPQAAYERASLIAYYLKKHKPRSKVLILDASDSFPLQSDFKEAWTALYPGMIEWMGGAAVKRVDAKAMSVVSSGGSHKADVANIIPPQKAGEIAHTAGLADADGWCPVDPRSMESTRHKGIHVIGDASSMPMSKSAQAAASQARVCAAAVVAMLNGKQPGDPHYIDATYSLLAPDYAISSAHVYRLSGDKLEAASGGGSPKDGGGKFRQREAMYARSWLNNMVHEMFG